MNCKFCGKEIGSTDIWCPWCGKKLSEEVVEEMTGGTVSEFSSGAVDADGTISDFSSHSGEAEGTVSDAGLHADYYDGGAEAYSPVPPVSTYTPETEGKAYKKKKKRTVFLSVLGILVILAAVGYFARASILMTVAPKYYTAWCFSNTADQLEKEGTEMRNALLGFEIDENTAYTSSVALSSGDAMAVSAKVANDPSAKTVYGEVSTEVNGSPLKLNMVLNDEIIGVGLPAVTEDLHFAVSSKDFGDSIMNTKISALKEALDKTGIDFSGMNLSYSAVNPAMNEETSKALKKEFIKAGFDFIKKGKVTDKSTDEIEIEEKDKKVKTVTIEFTGEDVKGFLVDYCRAIAQNEDIKDVLGEGYSKTMKQTADEIEDVKLDGEFEIDFCVYKDRVVAFEVGEKKSNVKIGVEFGSVKKMINDITVSVTTAVEVMERKIETTVELNAKGNHIPEDNVFDSVITLGTMGQEVEVEFEADFNKKKVKFVLDAMGQKVEGKGTCSNDKGFKLSLGEENFSVDMEVTKGAKVKELSGERIMVLEYTEKELGTKLVGILLPKIVSGEVDLSFLEGIIPGLDIPDKGKVNPFAKEKTEEKIAKEENSSVPAIESIPEEYREMIPNVDIENMPDIEDFPEIDPENLPKDIEELKELIPQKGV